MKKIFVVSLIGLMALLGFVSTYAKDTPKPPQAMWLDHLALLPGDSSVTTTHDAVNSGVGGGLAGLVVTSSTAGEDATGGGNKVVWMATGAPPGFNVVGVRLCYEYSKGSASFFSQTRLAQVQNPPATALIMLDDGTDLTSVGPVCVNSSATLIDPSKGSLLLSLRIFTGSISDKLVVRGLALLLAPGHRDGED